MFRRVLRFDTVDGYWRMDEQRYEDMITDREVDNMDVYRAKWLEAEAKRIKRQRRIDLLDTVLVYMMALILAGIVLIVIGILR